MAAPAAAVAGVGAEPFRGHVFINSSAASAGGTYSKSMSAFTVGIHQIDNAALADGTYIKSNTPAVSDSSSNADENAG